MLENDDEVIFLKSGVKCGYAVKSRIVLFLFSALLFTRARIMCLGFMVYMLSSLTIMKHFLPF